MTTQSMTTSDATENSIEELVHLHSRLVFKVASSVLRNHHDVIRQ